VIRQHIELLAEDERIKVMRLVDQLQAAVDAAGDKAVASMALTLVCARNLIDITSVGE
jgi:hypothetical protein